jgi:hypothetical protein
MLAATDLCRVGLRRLRRRPRERRLVQPDGEPEGAPPDRLAVPPGKTAHQFGNTPGDDQTQPRAAVFASQTAVVLLLLTLAVLGVLLIYPRSPLDAGQLLFVIACALVAGLCAWSLASRHGPYY